MNKLLLVGRYPQMAIDSLGHIRFLRKKVKKLYNDLDYISEYVFRLRNKINSQTQHL